MYLYNTLTRKIDEFIPNDPKIVKMYTCGPTVYNFAHIGNLRTYISEDILEKALKYVGFTVIRAMNITDVGHLTSDADSGEDKMLKGAIREKKSVWEIAEYYTNAFFEDCKKLNIDKPKIVVKATDHIDEYIKFIKVLEEKGYTYFINGNVYFDTSKFPNYTELSKNNIEGLKVASRETVSIDKNKKNPQDFVLWFTKSKFENHEMKWSSPWGEGYPGWHIECSAISLKFLGDHLDIHCGGVDHIPVHHTNEIAQTESYLGHKWCNYWIHGEFLIDKAGKMSKSSGEFLTLSLLERKGYKPLAFRLLCLGSHYRSQLAFSYEAIDTASVEYKKLKNKVESIKEAGKLDEQKYAEYDSKFKSALENDLNTSNALTSLYTLIKDNNVNNYTKLKLIKSWDTVLGLDLTITVKEPNHGDHEYIMKKIKEREEAKKNRNYSLADEIRNELLRRNVELIDTKEGTIYKVRERK